MNSARDAVTVFRTRNGGRANKLITLDADGKPVKDGAPQTGSFLAQQVQAPDLATVAAIWREVGARINSVLSTGLFVDAGPDPFLVLSRKRMAAFLGVDKDSDAVLGWHDVPLQNGSTIRAICRLKANMIHGSFLPLDRDLTDDMPPELAALADDGPGPWLEAMHLLAPPLRGAGCVLVDSTSKRVRLNGVPISTKPAFHAIFQVADPDELDRVWSQLLVKSFATTLPGREVPLGYLRPKLARDGSGRVVAHQPWSIYDPSTCSPERFIYDGKPQVIGAGLTVDPPAVQLIEGGRVDLSQFQDLTLADERAAERSNIKIERRKEKAKPGVRATAIGFFTVSATLHLDLELEIKDGWRTISELWIAGAGHTRCQSPFRQSDTWAAYYGVHKDGIPFLFDSAGIKYTLHPDDLAGPPVQAFVDELFCWAAIEDHTPAEDAFARISRIGAACGRHGWERAQIDDLAIKLAGDCQHAFAQKGAKLRDNLSRMLRAAAKAAGKARAAAEAFATEANQDDNLVTRMNAKFAVVTIGGSVRVAEPDVHDPCLGRKYIRIMSDKDFRLAHLNIKIPTPTRTDPDHETPLGQWWLEHPFRRQHLAGITLDPSGKLGPDYLNTWRGWAVEPVQGDCTVFLEHIHMITAGNGEDAAKYLTGWLASKVQNPGEQMEVAVVMRGDEGTGKGGLGHTMRRIFGGHGIHISQGEHLIGKFNAHLMDCCFLFADEAFFAGDPRHVSVLKALVTEDTITIEKKFVDAHQGRNRLGIMMASNSDFVVPAGKDARRYFCIDVPDTRMGDRAYFKRYFDAMNDPAQLGAFLHHLQNYDLTGFDVRDFPQTTMLRDQKLATLDQNEKWLLNRLGLGHFPDAARELDAFPSGVITMTNWTWREWAATSFLFQDYVTVMKHMGRPQFALDIVRFGTFMSRYFAQSRPRKNGLRVTGYQLGALDEARDAFAKYHGLSDIDWHEDEEEPDPPKPDRRRAARNGAEKSSDDLADEHWAAHPEDRPEPIPM